MNYFKEQWVGWVTLGLVLVFVIWPMIAPKNNWGAVNIENYVSAIMQNGYNSEKAITLSGASGDITTGDDLTVTDDATISGGALTVTTAANATSTIVVGGIQMYATSSATSICIFPSILGATTSSFQGTLYFRYGTAPCQL